MPDQKPAPPVSSRIPLWLRRMELFLYVIVRIYVGVILVVLPWTPMWDNSHVFIYFPRAASFFMSGAVRGIVSGLGLLNLWIAAEEAILYRASPSS